MWNSEDSQDSCFHGHGNPEPIGLEYIASSLENNNYTCKFVSDIELIVTSPQSYKHLVLLSGTTSQIPEILDAAFRANKAGGLTILGGYHVSGLSDFSGLPYIDFIIQGEGEEVAIALADALLNKKNQSEIIKSDVQSTPQIIRSKRIESLDALPFPHRSEEMLSRYYLYDLMWPPISAQRNDAIVLASRGCAYTCDFCASASVWGSGVRYRSPKNVVKELRDLKARFNTNTIIFIDQSLGQNKQWTLDLCHAIKGADLGMHWYHQSNLSLERDVLKAMADAGCTKIGFGLEGISTSAVERIKPVNSPDISVVNDLFDFCNSLGIFVKVYLMLGFPWETEEVVKEYFENLSLLHGNEIKISYFTPFPGTRDWDRYEDDLITREWKNFDTVQMPVVFNPHISVERYHEIRKGLFQAYYGSETYGTVTENMLRLKPEYEQSYVEFIDYLRVHEMITGKEKWVRCLVR